MLLKFTLSFLSGMILTLLGKMWDVPFIIVLLSALFVGWVIGKTPHELPKE